MRLKYTTSPGKNTKAFRVFALAALVIASKDCCFRNACCARTRSFRFMDMLLPGTADDVNQGSS